MIDLMPPRDRPQPQTALMRVPISFRLTDAQHTFLAALANARGTSMGAVAREAIDRLADSFTDASGRTMREAIESGDLDLEDFGVEQLPDVD